MRIKGVAAVLFALTKNDNITVIQKGVDIPLEQNYASYTYHVNGALETTLAATVTVTDANNNTARYEYDAYGRLEYWYMPGKTLGAGTHNAGDYEKYGYDANGNRTSWRKRDGKVITYTYDAHNRMLTKNIPNTTSEDAYYGYNNLDLQIYANFASHSGAGIRHAYSGFGEIKTETSTFYPSRTISYEYDKNSNRTKVTHPDNNHFVYEYDGLNRLTNIKENNAANPVIQHTWASEGTLWQIKRADAQNNLNNNITQYQFDDIKRMTDLDWKRSGSSFNERDFTYNPASQLVSVALSNHDFHYIGDNDLTGTWERNGLNQYTNINGVAYQYDNSGNLRSDSLTSYYYDAENRLTKAIGTKNITLKYDPMGRLRTSTSAGETTTFLYDGDALIAEYEGSTLKKRYIHGVGIDNPLIEYDGSTVSQSNRTYLHSNHQGSIVGRSDSSGNTITINTYDSFGIPHENNTGRFAYTGQIYLPEIEMYHYKARVYHPKLGRFLQTDPVGYEDQMNLYAYVGNDPMSKTDPTGMFSSVTTCAEFPEGERCSTQRVGEEESSLGGTRVTGEAAMSQFSSWQSGGIGHADDLHGGLFASKVQGQKKLNAGPYNTRSSATDVKNAMDAERAKNGASKYWKDLKGLLKVIKRGGKMNGPFLLIPLELLYPPEFLPYVNVESRIATDYMSWEECLAQKICA